jgi:hypothetical protein
MTTPIRVLDDAQLDDVGGGQSRIICTVSQEYITCTQGGVTVRMRRTDPDAGRGSGGRDGGTGDGGTGGGRDGGTGGGRTGRRR